MWRLLPTLLLVLLLLAGCVQSPSRPTPPEVDIAPLRAGLALRAASIRVRPPPGRWLDPSELWLFQGELSEYQLGKINHREIAEALSLRRVPATAWVGSDGTTLVPSTWLEAGGRYSLAAPELGLLAMFDVSPDDTSQLLSRVWPPAGQAGGELSVYCGSEAIAREFTMTFEPAGVTAHLSPGFGELPDGRQCGQLVLGSSDDWGPFLVPRAEPTGILLDPAPLQPATPAPPLNAICDGDEQSFGPGCIRTEDDRAILRAGPEPQLFGIATAPRTLWLAPAGGQFLLRGLTPDTEQALSGQALSPTGVSVACAASVRTGKGRSHLVLNEVLANPVGAEPAGEWVELMNDGGEASTLQGLSLRDATGTVALPNMTLAAGEYALLVREDYARPTSGDVPPLPSVPLVVLPSLGGNGLSNSGELLLLEDERGQIISAFPAVAAKHAGISVARRRPDSLDDDPEAFAEHGAPGASPGAANTFER
jgi:hypothetical protein